MNKNIIIFGIDSDITELNATKVNQDTGETISMHFYNGIGVLPHFISDENYELPENTVFYHLVPKNGMRTIIQSNGSFDKFYNLNDGTYGCMDVTTEIMKQLNYDKSNDEIVSGIMKNSEFSDLIGLEEFVYKCITAYRLCESYEELLSKSVERFHYDTSNRTIKVNGPIGRTIHGMKEFLHGNYTRVFTIDNDTANMFSELSFKQVSNKRNVKERDFESLLNDIDAYPGIPMCIAANPYSEHILFKLKEAAKEPDKIYIDPNLISNRKKRFNEV